MADSGYEESSKGVKGNAPLELKKRILKIASFTPPFGQNVFSRIVLTELDLDEYTTGDGKRKEVCRMVFETTVEEDMLNGGGNLHGGCSGWLIDNCSTIVLFAHKDRSGDYRNHGWTSQSLNFTLHSPARLGANLKIINTSVAIGERTSTIRSEIWDTTNERLIASGMHVKMEPSRPSARL